MSYRVCSSCKQELPLDMYSKRKESIQYACKTCDNAKQKERRLNPEINEKHKLRMRIRQYIRKYGLSEEEALALVQDRTGECDICGKVVPLVIDHCHISGDIRGRLCGPCNTGIGLFKENINSLEQAIEYLRSYS